MHASRIFQSKMMIEICLNVLDTSPTTNGNLCIISIYLHSNALFFYEFGLLLPPLLTNIRYQDMPFRMENHGQKEREHLICYEDHILRVCLIAVVFYSTKLKLAFLN